MITMNWKPWTAVTRKETVAAKPTLMTTFRAGTKWLDPSLVGARVQLVDESNNQVFAHCTIISVKAVLFKNIDQVDHERQSLDMTPERRLAVMQSVYGPDFGENSLTVVVTLGEIEAVA